MPPRSARGEVRRSSLNEFIDAVTKASVQLVANLNRASDLVQSFKQVAADRSRLERRRFDLGELTGQVLVGLRPELRKRSLVLDLACQPDLSMDSLPGAVRAGADQPRAQFDRARISRSAARGRSPSGLPHSGTDKVEIVVSDDGCGMSPEMRRQAFDPFFTTRRHEGATGLGLHIVHSMVVDRLEGRLSLTSEPGAGDNRASDSAAIDRVRARSRSSKA